MSIVFHVDVLLLLLTVAFILRWPIVRLLEILVSWIMLCDPDSLGLSLSLSLFGPLLFLIILLSAFYFFPMSIPFCRFHRSDFNCTVFRITVPSVRFSIILYSLGCADTCFSSMSYLENCFKCAYNPSSGSRWSVLEQLQCPTKVSICIARWLSVSQELDCFVTSRSIFGDFAFAHSIVTGNFGNYSCGK